MNTTSDFKTVIVIDDDLPVGLKCNTSAVLSLTLGDKIRGLIDKDLTDGSGKVHVGITNIPLPILKTSNEQLVKIYMQAKEIENILVVDFTDAAQTTKNYQDYEEKLKNKKTDELKLLGIALAGSKKDVNKFTGSLGLLR